MADAPLINLSALLLEREDMDAGVVQQLRTALTEAPSQFRSLRDAADRLEDHLERGKGDPAKVQLKLGVASYFLGRMERSAELLKGLQKSLARFYCGLAFNAAGNYAEAVKSLDAASKSGYAASEVMLHRAAALRGLGRYDESIESLKSLDEYVKTTAEYQFQYGSTLAAKGDRA
ncbi:MAG: tetratricopeptide repeat protein, partial [Planctomycetia bacterium]